MLRTAAQRMGSGLRSSSQSGLTCALAQQRMMSVVAVEQPPMHHASKYYMDLEEKHGAFNYAPMPVVLSRGEGAKLWDVDGKEYFDFASAYGSVNQGHCHPRIRDAMVEQMSKLTLTSRAFHNDKLGEYVKFITEYFGFDRALPMNTGVEGGETSIKLARRWGYNVKGIPENHAKVVFAEGNFWGRTLAATSSSTDPTSFTGFGPFMPGFHNVPYNDLAALEKEFKDDFNVCAYMVEAIQGEAGIRVPDEGYLSKVKALCEKYNVLLIVDEVQTGIGRTGKLLCQEYDGVKPDMTILGKSLSGGMFPVSAVLASHEIMLQLKPGEHGSTYGGNPLACAVATEALKVLEEEGMVENARVMGERLREGLRSMNSELITNIRGRGLFNGITIRERGGKGAYELCHKFMENGLLTKNTQGDKIRLAPPLMISSSQIDQSLEIIEKSIRQFTA